jgi:recombination protein U
MIGYPNKKKIHTPVSDPAISKARRGMSLEDDLNKTNSFYLDVDRAVIFKKPTPIQVVEVSYPARNKAKITEAYYRQASTTDYNGVYKGLPIDFEAKETVNKTSFSLAKLHKHQLDHLINVYRHGAIAFVLIRFSSLDETYLIMVESLMNFLKNHDRQSIPYDWIKNEGIMIPYSLTPPVDYLTALDKILTKGVKRNEEKK